MHLTAILKSVNKKTNIHFILSIKLIPRDAEMVKRYFASRYARDCLLFNDNFFKIIKASFNYSVH